jgi:hypothetical protein
MKGKGFENVFIPFSEMDFLKDFFFSRWVAYKTIGCMLYIFEILV